MEKELNMTDIPKDVEEQKAQEQEEIDDIETEYGFKGIEKLPLLEQVHRLFHAIKYKYPYQQTPSWKAMPIDQKRKILEYVREKRKTREHNSASIQLKALDTQSSKAQDALDENIIKSNEQINSTNSDRIIPQEHNTTQDPYLKMLRKRSYEVTESKTSKDIETALEKRKKRWKLMDEEFTTKVCSCGLVHTKLENKTTAQLYDTIAIMMITFGDASPTCLTTVETMYDAIREYVHSRLKLNQEAYAFNELNVMEIALPLRTLVEIFPEESIYYGRWREFRSETNDQTSNELDDIQEEELADELDLFAMSEKNIELNQDFLDRLQFADDRTKEMDYEMYDTFAQDRKMNFVSQKDKKLAFQTWLGLNTKQSRASLEFMNFVAYHNIGALVECAIKRRTNGLLQSQDKPLMKVDIDSILPSFLNKVNSTNSAQASTAMDTTEDTNSNVHSSEKLASKSTGIATEERKESKPTRLTRLKRLR